MVMVSEVAVVSPVRDGTQRCRRPATPVRASPAKVATPRRRRGHGLVGAAIQAAPGRGRQVTEDGR